jgi:hypothetical protein
MYCFRVSNAERILNQKFLHGGKIVIKYYFMRWGSEYD